MSVKKQVQEGWKYTVKYSKAGVTYIGVVQLEPDRKTMKLRSWSVEEYTENRE